MQEIVYENLKGTQEKQKKLYDQRSSRGLFNVGDKVLILLPTPGSKLKMEWQGPFTFSEVLENGLNYEVDRGGGGFPTEGDFSSGSSSPTGLGCCRFRCIVRFLNDM